MIADYVADRLRGLGVDGDIGRILDVLWLAGMLPERAVPSERGNDQEPGAEQDNRVEPVLRADPGGARPTSPARRGTGRHGTVRRPAWITLVNAAATAEDLPQALAIGRALRPLRHRRPAAVATELDEAATADRSARAGGRWLPVLRAPMRRWPDVAVIAETESELWNTRLAQVNVVLRRLGAFRQHREWRLRAPLDGRGNATVSPGLGGDLGVARNADRLADPTGRRLLLVLTDGASEGWSSGVYRDLFTRWARTGPVGIVSLVPPRLWPTPGMRATSRQIRVSAAWLPNRRWRAPGPAAPPIPIADLNPDRLAPFAAVFAGPGAGGDPSLLTLAPIGAARSRRAAATPGSLADTVREVRARLRPDAFALLTGLARVPLLLGPLLERATSIVAPESTLEDLAELLQSELVQPCEVRDNREHRRILSYRFRDPAVREELAQWRGTAEWSLLRWELRDYGVNVMGLSEEDTNRLLAEPDSRGAVLRVATHAPESERSGAVPVGYRHCVIEAVLRARRVCAAQDLAASLAEQGVLTSADPTFVAAVELLDARRRDELLGRPDRLLAVDDLESLYQDSDPRRGRARDHLIGVMAGTDGPTVALCGDRGHLRPLLELQPDLAGLADLWPLATTPADEIFALLNGRIRAHQLSWAPDVQQEAWTALSALYPQRDREGIDVYAVAVAAFNRLVGRWRSRSRGNLDVPLDREDLLIFTETDVPQWLAASS